MLYLTPLDQRPGSGQAQLTAGLMWVKIMHRDKYLTSECWIHGCDSSCRIYFQAKTTVSDFTRSTAAEELTRAPTFPCNKNQPVDTSWHTAAHHSVKSPVWVRDWHLVCPSGNEGSVCFHCWRNKEVTNTLSNMSNRRRKCTEKRKKPQNWSAQAESFAQQKQIRCYPLGEFLLHLNMHLGLNQIKTHHEQDASLYECMYNLGCSQRVLWSNKSFSLGEEMGHRTTRALNTVSLCAVCTNYTLI